MRPSRETVSETLSASDSFTAFVQEVGARLKHALMAAGGPEAGREAAADALVYAWEHWDRIRTMENPAGYVYRVGRNRIKRSLSVRPSFPLFEHGESLDVWVEPALTGSLAALTEKQRTAVVLVYACDLNLTETARLLKVTPGTVHKHAQRGLEKLQAALEVDVHA